jgi:hypothetical protein
MPFRKAAYSSETMALMGRAYDSAINDLKHSDVAITERVKAAIAVRIFAVAGDGERDPNQLLKCALEAANRVKTIIGAAKGLEAFRGASPYRSTSLPH